MSKPAAPDEQGTSTRPYLIRALHDWCTDNGFTPYLAVYVSAGVQVPMEYVKNNEIVLNVGFEATSGLKLGNEFIEFKARFAGSAREIMVPIGRVIAIYARENGQGMAFPLAVSPSAPFQPTSADGEEVAVQAMEPAPGLASEAKVVQMVPPNNTSSARDDDPEPPEPPKPQQGKRPSLKRVK